MPRISRRTLLRAAAAGVLGTSAGGWFSHLAHALEHQNKRRHCVLLWMTGGPTQTDTFDMKPGHANGGEFKEAQTSVPGLRFSEHLPKLAAMADTLAIVRSLSTKEGDHGRGTYLIRTGHQPMGPIQYPSIGSSIAKELGRSDDAMPQNVSIGPYRAFSQAAFGPGFLGPRHAPLTVGAADNIQPTPAPANGYAELKVDDLTPPTGVDSAQLQHRLGIWKVLQNNFISRHSGASPIAHNTVYERALSLMDSKAAEAFDLSREPDNIREAYGRGRFGQGCLMARRLIESGVSFVEVTLGDFDGNALAWDTHQNNFAAVRTLSEQLDTGWSMLMRELDERGLLDSTTFLWIGEFGRTPQINPQGGRDHFPAAWSCVFGGAGIKGGQAYGKTSADGQEVEEGKVDIGDVLATLARALDIDPESENISDVGRPIKIAEGKPIGDILT